jgi:hypothetical protein
MFITKSDEQGGSKEEDEEDHYGEHYANGGNYSSRVADPRANQVPSAPGVPKRGRSVPCMTGMSAECPDLDSHCPDRKPAEIRADRRTRIVSRNGF